MNAKISARGMLGVALVVALVLAAALLLVPSFAVGLGRLLADLWVTVMGAVAGLLAGVFAG